MTGGRKFAGMWAGVAVILLTALTGHMDGNVALSLSVVVGGFYGGNSYVSGKALAVGKPDPERAP